ncbi:hypothetical protein JL684_04345, partial [Mycoplasmopsis bovis]
IDYSKGTHKQNAEKISEFINTKIHDEFKKYNQGKTTPIEIDKDVKISYSLTKQKAPQVNLRRFLLPFVKIEYWIKKKKGFYIIY